MRKLLLLIVCLMAAVSLQAQEKKELVLNEKTGLIEAKLFHDTGELAQTGFYTEDGKLQGEWISYDVSGNKTAVAQYDAGKKVGTWFFYQGETLKEVTFQNNAIAAVKTWAQSDSRIVTSN